MPYKREQIEPLAKRINDYWDFRESLLENETRKTSIEKITEISMSEFENGWHYYFIEIIKNSLQMGFDMFLGLHVDIPNQEFLKDTYHKKIYQEWQGKGEIKRPFHKYYENFYKGNIFVKGEKDSNAFLPVQIVVKREQEYVVFPADFRIADLPDGTRYVDCR